MPEITKTNFSLLDSIRTLFAIPVGIEAKTVSHISFLMFVKTTHSNRIWQGPSIDELLHIPHNLLDIFLSMRFGWVPFNKATMHETLRYIEG